MTKKPNTKKIKIMELTSIIILLISIISSVMIFNNSYNVSDMYKSGGNGGSSFAYTEVTDDDYETDADGVKFAAYFINGSSKVNGTNNRIGYEDSLYFDLSVEDGTLSDAIITINGTNFYLQTNLVSDSVIDGNYISENTTEIGLQTIDATGTEVSKVITGNVRSGNYDYVTEMFSALGNDIDNYSATNTITLTATYTPTSGSPVTITKDVEVLVEWYGEISTEIPDEIYGNDNTLQTYDITQAIDTENDVLALTFTVGVQSTANEVLLSESIIEGVVPLINEVAPTSVSISGTNVESYYDESTRTFTAYRSAIMDSSDESVISEQAYSGTYAENNINYRYNEYTVTVEYPLSVYDSLDPENYINITIPITATYEGFNGESDTATGEINVIYTDVDSSDTGFGISLGRYVLYPEARNIISTDNINLVYQYSESGTIEDLEETFYSKWSISTSSDDEYDSVTLSDGLVNDIFVSSDGTETDAGDYISYTGIAFSNPLSVLGKDGYIRVYNADTGALLEEFTSDNWNDYDTLNPYEYSSEVKHIKIETSAVSGSSYLIIYNIKSFDIEALISDIDYEDFSNIEYVQSNLQGSMTESGQTTNSISSATAIAYLEQSMSIVDFDITNTVFSTQETETVELTIEPITSQYNTEYWFDAEYLIKFPESVINVNINSIQTNNDSNITISDYYIYEQDGYIFLKINTENDTAVSYKILVNCDVSVDPTSETSEETIELYSYNSANDNYYEANSTSDIWDLNGNSDTDEIVGYNIETITIEEPSVLLTYEYTVDSTGDTVYAPLASVVDSDERTATVNIVLKNNDDTSLTDIKILGTVPYEGNTYYLSGDEIGSEYSAEMTSDGIKLPAELEGIATIYYSTEEEVSDDATDASSNWTTSVSDCSQVKHFMILLNTYNLDSEDTVTISYDITIPNSAEYNDVTYSTHVVYYSQVVDESTSETSRSSIETEGLGFQIIRQFNLDLTVLSKEDGAAIEGATFRLTKSGVNRTSVILTSDENGKITYSGLLLNIDYTIKQTGTVDEYICDETEIEFTASESQGEIVLTTDSDLTVDQDSSTVIGTIYNEVKYNLNLNSFATGTTTGVVSSFTLTGNGTTTKLTTDLSGNVILEGLIPGVEYTLTETYSTGYYINGTGVITFTVSRNNQGELELTYIDGTETATVVLNEVEVGEICPVLNITVYGDLIPTYTLVVNLYVEDTSIALDGATYKITGGGKESGVKYTTNSAGKFTVSGLYVGDSDTNESGEYTLKEVTATTGYHTEADAIEFVVEVDEDGYLNLNITSGTYRDYTIDQSTNTVTLNLENREVFSIRKVDIDTGEGIEGATFAIYKLDDDDNELAPTDDEGNELGTALTVDGVTYNWTFTTNEDGYIEEAEYFSDGIYKIVEIIAAEGYELAEDEEDRITYLGVGESRSAVIESSFSDPTEMESGSGTTNIYQYCVEGREDGYALYYYNGTLKVIDENNETYSSKTTSNLVYQIISYGDYWYVLYDSSIVIYDDNLNTIKTISITSGMRTFDIDDDGGFVVAGIFSGTKTFGSVSLTSTKTGTGWFASSTYDIYVIEVDSSGNIETALGIGYTGSDATTDAPSRIDIISDGFYALSGHVPTDSLTDYTSSGTNSTFTGGSYKDCVMTIRNTNGSLAVESVAKTGTSNGVTSTTNAVDTYVNDILVGTDGYLYYVGQFSGTIRFAANQTASGSAITVESNGDTDAIIIKFDTDLKVVWAQAVGGDGQDHIYSACISPSGYIVVGGDSYSGAITVDAEDSYSGKEIVSEPVGDVATSTTDSWRGITFELTTEGKVVWAWEFGYSSDEGCYAVAVFSDDSFALCGFDTISSSNKVAVFIRVTQAVTSEEISEVSGLEIQNSKATYDIYTSVVDDEEGTITGYDNEDGYVETVKYGEDATTQLIIEPATGYEILSVTVNDEKLSILFDDDGEYVYEIENGTILTITQSGSNYLIDITSVKEDINIEVDFADDIGTVLVHHYLWNEDTDEGTTEKVAEDDIYVGIVGDEYTTYANLEIDGYELYSVDGEYYIPDNASGKYVKGETEVIYYYVEKPVIVTVNYYIEGTTTSLIGSITYSYTKGTDYTTYSISELIGVDETLDEDALEAILEGYVLTQTPSNSIGIADTAETVVTYYYSARPTYSYTIEYYYDDEIGDLLTVKDEAYANTEIEVDVTTNLKDGYEFDSVENATYDTDTYTLIVSTDEDENVVKVYYKSREDLTYTVEYYYDGVRKDEYTEKVNNVKYGTVVTTYTDKVIEGYQLQTVTGLDLTVGTNTEENVIKVYYTKRNDLNYTINYLEKDTNIDLETSKTVTGQTYLDTIYAEDEKINIEGYDYDSADPESMTIQVDSSLNVINIYYTKKTDLIYTVNYLEKDTYIDLEPSKTVTGQTYLNTIYAENEKISIEGYDYDSADPESITIQVDSSKNVINLYYTKRTDLSYTVNYYEEGETTPLIPSKTVTGQTYLNTIYAENEKIGIEGYDYDSADPESIKIQVDSSKNVINLYYTKKTDLSFTVNYWDEDEGDLLYTKTENNQTYSDKITSSTYIIDIKGYEYSYADPDTLTIGATSSENIINLYYTKSNGLSYTVQYLEEGTNTPLHDPKEETNQTYKSSVTEEAIDIDGYDKVAPTSQTITIEADSKENVITFYYTKRTDLEYTVKYLEQGTDSILHEAKTEKNQTYNSSVTEEAIDIGGYDKVTPISQTITIDVENNIITFYYTKRTDLKYTVNYLELDTDEELEESKTVEDQTYLSQIDSISEVITIKGYKYDSVDPEKLEIGYDEEKNVINIYYTKVTGLSYTVNYLEKDTNKTLSPSNTVENQNLDDEIIAEDEVIKITGYNYDSVDCEVLVIGEDETKNVINIYYTARDDLEYTVNYIDKDTDEALASSKVVKNQTYNTSVTEEAIDIEGYNNEAPTSQTIVITEEKNEINFYYTIKTDLSYTVNYIDQDTNESISDQKVVENQTYNTSVTEEAIDVEGYNKASSTSQTITISDGDNVINFYYTKRTDLSYTVNYLEQDTNEVLAESKTVENQIYLSSVKEEAIDIEGYDKVAPITGRITISINDEDNVINFYYIKRTDLSYTVNYLEYGTTDQIYTSKTVTGQTYLDIITSEDEIIEIQGYKYISVDPESITIEVDESKNVMNIYYTKQISVQAIVTALGSGSVNTGDETPIIMISIILIVVLINAIQIIAEKITKKRKR